MGRHRQRRQSFVEGGFCLTKECRHCEETKPVTDFRPRNDRPEGQYASWCRVCEANRHRERLKSNPDLRDQYRAARYGLTLEELRALEDRQDNTCAICGVEEEGKALSIDHCHNTDEVRGLLCQNCNRGLGSFMDNQYLLQKAIEYLDQPSWQGATNVS